MSELNERNTAPDNTESGKDRSAALAKIAIEVLEDKKAEDIRVIDISDLSVLADFFIIATGNNRTQVQAMADEVEQKLGRAGAVPKQIEGYQAANDPDHKDTLRVSFTAEGVSQNGEYNVDFQTLQYSGTTWSEERETISDTLSFWPQGNRTVSYPYGTISSSYIITFRSMNITAVSGSIYLMGRAAVS